MGFGIGRRENCDCDDNLLGNDFGFASEWLIILTIILLIIFLLFE